MKVNNSVTSSIDKAPESKGTSKSGAAKNNSEKNSSIRGDGYNENVSISSRAKESALAKEVAKSSPDINEDKVARLKEQINKGMYKVDTDKIADRLLEEHLSF